MPLRATPGLRVQRVWGISDAPDPLAQRVGEEGALALHLGQPVSEHDPGVRPEESRSFILDLPKLGDQNSEPLVAYLPAVS